MLEGDNHMRRHHHGRPVKRERTVISTVLLGVLTLAASISWSTSNAAAESGNGVPGTARVAASKLDIGGDSGCAIRPSGALRCWGQESFGQWGGASLSTDATATGGGPLLGVSLGDITSCVVRGDSGVRCFGHESVTLPAGSASKVSMGNADGPCIVTMAGGVRCIGSSWPSTGWTGGSSATADVPFTNLPSGAVVVEIATGNFTTCALFSTGGVRCWGLWQDDPASVFGGSSLGEDVPGLPPVVALSVSGGHVCSVGVTGSVYCWGDNNYNQSNWAGGFTPVPVFVWLPGTAVAVTTGTGTSCALLAAGPIYCWGGNYSGNAGQPPARILLGPDQNGNQAVAVAVSTGRNHACATLTTDEVRCWNSDVNNSTAAQFGGSSRNVSVPFVDPIDSTPPTAVGITASPDSLFAAGATALLTATGTDNVGLVKVEFYDEGNTLIGTDTTPADGFSQVVSSFPYGSPPNLATAGTYRYTAKLFDAAGNSTTTANPATVTVAAAPETTIDSGPDPVLTSSSTTAEFSFSANPATGATFECALDGGSFAACIPVAGLTDGTHTYQVRASNIGGTDSTPATRTWKVELLAAPTFTPNPPATATFGLPYSHQFSATGVPSTITFSAPPGSLPLGLTLTPAGLLSGTPSAFGSTSFVVTASNGVGPDATAQVTIEVQAAPAFTAFTPPTTGTVGTDYAGYTFAAEGFPSTITFSVASGSLPDGLTLSEGGILSGRPTAAAAAASPSRFTVSATNSVGSVTTGEITITVTGVVAASPDLLLRMEVDGPARTGSLLTYQLSVRNLSSTAAAGPITIVTQLPAGVTYQSGGNRQWVCTSAGQVVTCVRASGLRASDATELKIVARIAAPAGTTLITAATLLPTDFNPSNNIASNSTLVRRRDR